MNKITEAWNVPEAPKNKMTNQSEVKHTGLPYGFTHSDKDLTAYVTIDDGRTAIAKLYPQDGSPKANAQFIVTACNSHYELLEACNKSLAYLRKLRLMGKLHADGIMAEEKLEQAIKKAEGG